MKTLPFLASVTLAAGVLVSTAVAQTAAVEATPAPAIALPSTPAPAVADQARPAPDRIIYVPRLPSAAELANVARAQGLAIVQIDQTAADVTITYRFADGRASAVAYQLLPEGGVPPPTAAVVGRSAPTVVYYQPAPAPRVVYYNRPAVYYDPFYYPWYGPVSLSVGLGYSFYGHGHGHGHFRGGHRGGHGRW